MLGNTWDYEITTFELTDTISYTPDFKVNNQFFELKGRMTDQCQNKIILFKEKYSDIQLNIIGEEMYKHLTSVYKKLIPLWEGK